ncbi:hypothetical protein JTB14_018977 [Gonioctena quinquepunctata]|nr:hypothetical protein JTB14_018977 [Gonioctena quinquepunctata]
MRVKTQDGFTKVFNITTGGLQGESLSPTLFSLFIAYIEDYFKKKGAQSINIDNEQSLLMLLYADDLVILSDSEVDLAKKLRILGEYCDENILTVNSEKTKIIQFCRSSSRRTDCKFTYKNLPIESTNSQ